MENQKVSTKPVILNYGLLLGVATVLFSVAIYAVNGMSMERPLWQKVLSIAIMIAAIILGIKKYKEFNNGKLTLGQAMKTGLGISLIGGLIAGIYTYIFFAYVEPEFMTQVMEIAQEKMMEQNPDMPDDQVEMAMSMSRKFSSPTAMLFFSVIGSLIFGAIISVIGGLVMRKEEQVY